MRTSTARCCIPAITTMPASAVTLSTRHRHRRGAGASRLPIGVSLVRRSGEKIAILNFGTPAAGGRAAAEGLNATLVDMRFVKPLDEQLVPRTGRQP